MGSVGEGSATDSKSVDGIGEEVGRSSLSGQRANGGGGAGARQENGVYGEFGEIEEEFGDAVREDTDSSMVQKKMKTAEYAEEFRKASLRLLPYWFSFFFVLSFGSAMPIMGIHWRLEDGSWSFRCGVRGCCKGTLNDLYLLSVFSHRYGNYGSPGGQ